MSDPASAPRRTVTSFVAGSLLILAALAAPWLAGAQTTLPNVRWWLGGALAAAFFVVVFGRLAARRLVGISPWAGLGALFLLGCLGVWATRPEPNFSTLFGDEHWKFLNEHYPRALFQLPRLERLGFFACIILGFLAAIDLGRRETFRRQLTFAIGLSGMGVALYALGFDRLGFPALPWTLIDDGTERLNVCFAHYSGPAACLNLAWPLLAFGVVERFAWIRRVIPVLLVTAALPLWDSAAAKAIPVGLLIAGAGWRWGETRGWFTPGLLRTALGLALVAVFSWQTFSVWQMRAPSPDGWISSEKTLEDAPVFDAELRTLAEKRGDHLLPSNAPGRQSAWLCAARMAADSPLIGLGPGAWVKRSALYSRDPAVNTFSHYRQYAHHDLLQFAAEWGGLAALAALFLFAGGIWQAMQRHPADIGIVLALVGVALHSTVDFPLQNPALQIWTALLLGLTWSQVRRK